METEGTILGCEVTHEVNHGEDVEKREQPIIVSINSLMANIGRDSSTIRVRWTVGHKTLHILLDTGSSHNFLSDRFSKLSSEKIKEIPHLQLTVANGGRVKGTKMVEMFSWIMQRHKFLVDTLQKKIQV